tara:strand:- start:2646 stop:3353 length:708 start_codon:yes stop_codon:yes gene_type:complete
MSEETNQEAAPTGNNNEELLSQIKALESRVQSMDVKNKELLDEKKKFQKLEQTLSTMPDGTDVQKLLEFKQKAEQAELEAKGKYSEALQARDQQFREASATKDEQIKKLEQRVKELELITPTVSALADIVHDPDMVLKTKLSPEQIKRREDGTVVVVDGYEETPVAKWAESLPDWLKKSDPARGSGAPIGRKTSGNLPIGMDKNPFENGGNLTEQMRLYKTNRPLYDQLKAAAKN